MDFRTIKAWLKLPPTQRTLAVLAVVIVVLYRAYIQEKIRNDFNASNRDSICNRQAVVYEEKIKVRDSVIAAKNQEIQVIYKTQADELRKATAEVESIKRNSTIIKRKAEKLSRDK